jgi:hypothetical protein
MDRIVRFGKYNGKPLSKLLEDISYVEWCKTQPWLGSKYPDVYQIICKQETTPTKVMTKYTTNSYNNVKNEPQTEIDGPPNINRFQIIKTLRENGIKEKALSISEDLYPNVNNNTNQSLLLFSQAFIKNNNYDHEEFEICRDLAYYYLYGISYKITKTPEKIRNLLKTENNVRKVRDILIDSPDNDDRTMIKKYPFLLTKGYAQLQFLCLNQTEQKQLWKMRYDDIMGINASRCYSIQEELVKGIVKNPYVWYRIPINQCDRALNLMNRPICNEDRSLGEISRAVFKRMHDFNWTATPYEYLKRENKFDEAKANIKRLETEYGLKFDRGMAYIKSAYDAELKVSDYMLYYSKLASKSNIFVDDTCEVNGKKLTEEQMFAVKGALKNDIFIVTGRGGVGKTSIIKALTKIITSNTYTYCAMSFTGKAVERIRDVLGQGCIAKTIHSYCASAEFYDYFIFDEATMISLKLFSKFVDSLEQFRKNGLLPKIILLGDINQLPPLSYGRPFEELVLSQIIPTYHLTKNLRVVNGADDPIIVNSNAIVDNEYYSFEEGVNCSLSSIANLDSEIIKIIDEHSITLADYRNYKFIAETNDIVCHLNQTISNFLNPKPFKFKLFLSYKKDKITDEKKEVIAIYRTGDPVIFTKNKEYGPNIFNGTEGIIFDFKEVSERDVRTTAIVVTHYMIVTVNGENIEVEITRTNRRHKHNTDNGSGSEPQNDFLYTVNNVYLSYAITIHKSQGSEWKHVYIVCGSKAGALFANKRLSYTALTRAKETCNIFEFSPGIFENWCRKPIMDHKGGFMDRLLYP